MAGEEVEVVCWRGHKRSVRLLSQKEWFDSELLAGQSLSVTVHSTLLSFEQALSGRVCSTPMDLLGRSGFSFRSP